MLNSKFKNLMQYRVFQTGDTLDMKKYWSPKLYIENVLGDPKEKITFRLKFNEKGEAFITEKRVVKGTFMENLELNDFPFDVQVRERHCHKIPDRPT